MPLFFSRRPLSSAGGRPDPQAAASQLYLAANTAQGSSRDHITASPLVFPRYLDGRDACACVFSLPPVDGRWVDAVLRQLRGPRPSASEKCTRGRAEGDDGFVDARRATQGRRWSCRSPVAYMQRVTGSPPQAHIKSDNSGAAAAASIWSCGLRLVWRERPVDTPPRGDRSAAAASRTFECGDVAGMGSWAAGCDVVAYPTPFEAPSVLDGGAGEGKTAIADACGSVAGASLCAGAEPRTPLAHHPRRTHIGARYMTPGPELDPEVLAWCWRRSVHEPVEGVEEAAGGGQRNNTLSPQLSPDSPPQRRLLREVRAAPKHEVRAGLGAPLRTDGGAHESGRPVDTTHSDRRAGAKLLVEMPDELVLGLDSPHAVNAPPLRLSPSLLPARSQWARKRPRSVLEAELFADLTARCWGTAAQVSEAPWPPQAAPGPRRHVTHWPSICSSTTPNASSRGVGALSVSGSLPQRCFAEMESFWHFSLTVPSFSCPLRIPWGDRGEASWSVVMLPATWLQRSMEGGHDSEATLGGVRPAVGAEVAVGEAFAGAQAGATAMAAPKLTVVRHARLRCLMRGKSRGCGGAERPGCRAASKALQTSRMGSRTVSLTAEALSAQWGAFVADLHGSRMAQERERAAFTHEQWEAAAASLMDASDDVADILASLLHVHSQRLHAAKSESHRKRAEQPTRALNAGAGDSICRLGQAYPYPVLEWWQWASCRHSRTHPPQHSQQLPHRPPETCTVFHSAPDGVEATAEQRVWSLLCWARGMSDVQWRTASWLPWDSWIAAICAVARVPLLLLPLSSSRASLLMPSTSRLQNRLRIAVTEDEGAPPAACLAAGSLALGCCPTKDSTESRALERQPWSALDAASQLLAEATASATLRPRWLLPSVAQRDANDDQRQHLTVRAAAVAECEALARACERYLRALSQERERGATVTAAAARASAARTLHHCLLQRRRCEGAATVATSGDGVEPSDEVAAARFSSPTPRTPSLSPHVAVSPSSPAVEYAARGHADSATVGLLGEHARSPPATVPLLAPSESLSVREVSSAEGAGTGNLSASEAVGRKRARSVAASTPAGASPCDSAIASASFACSVRASSPQVESGGSLSSLRFSHRAQRSSTPQRMLAAWLEQRCREEVSAADDSPSRTPSAAATEAGVALSSGGAALLGPRPSLQTSPPPVVSSAGHSCLDSDQLRRVQQWLLAPPHPTRLPFASSQQRWRCADVISESAGPRTPTTHVPVSRWPARSRPCTRQALLQDALPLEPPVSSTASVVHAPKELVGTATVDAAAPAPVTCVDGALQSPTDQSTEAETTTGGSGGIALRLCLPVKPPRGLGDAPVKSVAVWRWAQLTLHNYAADTLDSAILRGARTLKPSLRAANEATTLMSPTAPPAASQTAAYLSAPAVVKNSTMSALAGDFTVRALPPPPTAPRGQPPAIDAAILRLFMTAPRWRLRGARRAAQRLTFHRLILTDDVLPPPSLPLLSRPLSQAAEGEETAFSHEPEITAANAASTTTRVDGLSTIGAQLYRDELERNDEVELAQCVREALVCAQHTACVSTFQRRIQCGEGGGGKLAETQRSTNVCCSAALHSCASRNAAPDGNSSLVPAPLSSWPLLAPRSGRCCVAREARLHRIVLDGVRRDGWLLIHTFWYDALSGYVSTDSLQTCPACLLSAAQGSVATHAASCEEDGPAESADGAPPQPMYAPQARIQQRDIDFLDVRVDTEPDAAVLEASAHEMRWYVDTSDEEDEWGEAVDEADGAVAPDAEGGSSQWCCCCLASHADLTPTTVTQGEGLAAATTPSTVAAPALGRSKSHCGGGALPPLCPAWWRGGATTGATTTSAASSTPQRRVISANARAAACAQIVRRACRSLYHHLDAGDGSVPPPLTPRPLPRSLDADRRHGGENEGALDEMDNGMGPSGATARFFLARPRRYVSQLLCRDAFPARSAAVAAESTAHRHSRPPFSYAHSSSPDSSRCCCCCCNAAELLSTPSLQLLSPRSGLMMRTAPGVQQPQEEDEDDVEEQVAALCRCRYTRHVCTFAEEAQSLQAWLLPHWWAAQQQRVASLPKAQQPLPLSRKRRCPDDPLDGSDATGATSAHDDVGGEDDIWKRARLSSSHCFRARSEEAEAWVQLLHYAHLRQLRRPYGPLFHDKSPQRCALLGGCVADAEVHYTYLVAMLRQRAKVSAER
ncbi:hypothetical protein JIQ42_06547 [Leishmania sp. Namibia]|uniref:hypothetical protein n=1 Tax=Leishmania sp. Namibia TaxID=2802991 RepID=UPI001B52C4AF|nr:hypothetical protein JIQ42_06547 [Leishmania sp. Namibia]